MPADHPNAETGSKPPVATFRPRPHPLLPVEVISRSEIRRRRKNANLGGRHTHDFHQLVVCENGEGVHHVDLEPIPMHPGRVLHIHPGQTHEYQFEPDFEASVVVYRSGVFRTATPSGQWFPGTGPSMVWDFTDDDFDEITSTVADIRTEQDRFDGSVLSVMLIENLLATLLVRLLRQPTEHTARRLPRSLLAVLPARRGQLPNPTHHRLVRPRARLQHTHPRPRVPHRRGAFGQGRPRRPRRPRHQPTTHRHRRPDQTDQLSIRLHRSSQLLQVRRPPPRQPTNPNPTTNETLNRHLELRLDDNRRLPTRASSRQRGGEHAHRSGFSGTYCDTPAFAPNTSNP